MIKVTVVDVVIEFVFGLVAGCLTLSLVVGVGMPTASYLFIVFFVVLCMLGQVSVDLLRGRGWRYSLACGVAYGAGIATGGLPAFAGLLHT